MTIMEELLQALKESKDKCCKHEIFYVQLLIYAYCTLLEGVQSLWEYSRSKLEFSVTAVNIRSNVFYVLVY